MNNEKTKMSKDIYQKGITLIALVITIIVLLILAGISISMITGEEGILSKTKEATEEFKQAEKGEQAIVNGYLDTTTGQIAPIPEGFYYVGGTVASGVVISDNPNDKDVYAGKADVGTDLEGNQWVWVPVSNPETMYEKPETPKGVDEVVTTTTEKYSKMYKFEQNLEFGDPEITTGNVIREPDIMSLEAQGEIGNFSKIISRNTREECESVQEVADQYVEDYNDMIDSIEKYKGFYVGRYELTGSKENPIQKVGAVMTTGETFNWYNYYNACQNFYTDSNSVQSTMIWGTQWDAIMNWIQSTSETTRKYVDATNKSYTNVNNNIQGWGNYDSEIFPYDGNSNGIIEDGEMKPSIMPLQTGVVEHTKVNNIYDLAGNYAEWTQEVGQNYQKVLRGGTFHEKLYAAYRETRSVSANASSDITSRPTLYIK